MKNDSLSRKGFTRREFIRTCGISTAAIAASSILGGFKWNSYASTKLGPAAYTFPLNQNWLFGGRYNPDAIKSIFNDKDFTKVTLPHCVSKLSWQNWNPGDWENMWIYRRHFNIPEEYAGARIFLNFDGAMVGITPIFNDYKLPEHMGGYLPVRYEITNQIKDGDNVLAVVVDSRWSNVPPEGSPEGSKRIDYLEPGGIYRSVNLRVLPQTFISDVFAKPVKVLDPNRRIDVKCSINSADGINKPVRLLIELKDGAKVIAQDIKNLKIEKSGELEVVLSLLKLGDIKLWDIDAPHLYDVVATLYVGDKTVHDFKTRIGIRDARFEGDGFFLNGRRLQLFGLNRHELYPYSGFAMPSRVMRRDAEILKHDFNCNVVRCSHYPQSEAFLNACDELGLMVWEEVPGWGYLGDESWKKFVIRDVHDMIVRDRNHPSIVIWGVRVNESPNDPVLYRKTRAMAKLLDDSRPTSGSMTDGSIKTWKEDWHQDVLAYDDYHADPKGGVGIFEPPADVPYMLAEAVGQFNYYHPKEGFNSKYRRAGDITLLQQQAVWHAQAHSKAAANSHNCGVIAWCGFDYASQVNPFNNVKCPGIADVFRIPKLGASFYQAQISPKTRPVVVPNFYWNYVCKNPYEAGKNVSIFSNCDKLKLYINGKQHAVLTPDKTNFPNIKFPPFFADFNNLEGLVHPVLRIEGFVGEKPVISKSFASDDSQIKFALQPDDFELIGDGIDSTRLVFKTVDKFGEDCLCLGGHVDVKITGPGEIVGDNPFQLDDSGGVGAVWIKTKTNGSGKITIEANHSSLGTKSVIIKVLPENQAVKI